MINIFILLYLMIGVCLFIWRESEVMKTRKEQEPHVRIAVCLIVAVVWLPGIIYMLVKYRGKPIP